MGVLEADIDGSIFNEEIANTEESTYAWWAFTIVRATPFPRRQAWWA